MGVTDREIEWEGEMEREGGREGGRERVGGWERHKKRETQRESVWESEAKIGWIEEDGGR